MKRCIMLMVEWHNIVSGLILPKLMYRFKSIPIKIPTGIFSPRNWQADAKMNIERKMKTLELQEELCKRTL